MSSIIISHELDIASSKRLAEELGAVSILLEERIFPDGEIKMCVKRPTVLRRTEELIVLFYLYPNPNIRLFELFQSLDMIRDYAPDAVITLILPYLTYARQDKRFLARRLC